MWQRSVTLPDVRRPGPVLIKWSNPLMPPLLKAMTMQFLSVLTQHLPLGSPPLNRPNILLLNVQCRATQLFRTKLCGLMGVSLNSMALLAVKRALNPVIPTATTVNTTTKFSSVILTANACPRYYGSGPVIDPRFSNGPPTPSTISVFLCQLSLASCHLPHQL